MRVFSIVILLVSLIVYKGGSQCPIDKTLDYKTQNDIDTFKLKYPNCKYLTSIYLTDSSTDPILNLAGFSNLDSLTNDLTINNQTKLITLSGLENLKKVRSLRITNCVNLRDLNGLIKLSKLKGNFYLENNEQLKDIKALVSLDSVSSYLVLKNLNSLESLEGLNKLRVLSALEINNCDKLLNLSGIGNLINITSDLKISECNSLIKIDELKLLRNIKSSLTIENNANIKSINDFSSLKSIGSALNILNNASLNTISGFNSLETINTGALTIKYNEKLEVINGFNSLGSIKKELEIKSESLRVVNGFNSLESANIEFSNYADLEHIIGFEKIKFLQSLILRNNPKLKIIPNFNNVESITGVFDVDYNKSLKEITGFNKLHSHLDHLNIAHNDSLLIIPLFSSLTSAINIIISFNPSLKNIEGFEILEKTNVLLIRGNLILASIPDFNLLTEVKENIYISSNNNLANFPKFLNLRKVNNGLSCISNNKVTNVFTCPNLDTINGALSFTHCELLEEISGFSSLNMSNGVTIGSNPKLKSIPLFDSIVSISSFSISITYNTELESIRGFNNLVNTVTEFEISGNGITSIDGFSKLEICKSLTISKNPNLINLGGFNLVKANRIIINENSKLVSISSFNNLSKAYDNTNEIYEITIYKNPSLINFDGFNNVVNCQNIQIIENESLKLINGFSNLQVAKTITIRGNSIVSIPHFNKLLKVGSERYPESANPTTTGIYLKNMPQLKVIYGFEMLDSVKGNLVIESNINLEEINAFHQVKMIVGDFEIINNDSLDTFLGMEKLLKIGVDYTIKGNNKLKELPPTRNLYSVGEVYWGGQITLSGDSINSLLNLRRLNSFAGQIVIYKTNLSNLKGLENLNGKIVVPYLENNPKLSDCAIPYVCQNITNTGSCNNIKQNAPGCNSCAEIQCIETSIGGTIFYDANKNKKFDENEIALDKVRINILEDDVILLPKNSGRFEYNCRVGNHYTIIPQINSDWKITTDSLSYKFVYQNGMSRTSNLDFGLFPLFNVHEGSLGINSGATRCNMNVEFNIKYSNRGTYDETGQLILSIDPLANFVSADISPKEISGNKVIWNYSNLKPFEERILKVIIRMPNEQKIGELLFFNLEMVSGNKILSINQYTPTVICAHDPNDKIVMPADSTKENFVANDQDLTYTIRFQNEGNSEAINISVLDTISTKLDVNTLEIVSSSHPLLTEIKGNIAKFNFNNIWLVSKNVDEFESMGFVTYKIKLNDNQKLGQKIYNKASIYFDFNSPIHTNTTTSTIMEPNEVINTTSEDSQIILYPNPCNNILQIQSSTRIKDISIYSLTGSLISKGTNRYINTSLFNSGSYIVKIKTDKIETTKLILVYH